MTSMDDNFSFGYWLRRQRLARDLRQDDLAAQLGVATITLRKLEADERRPSLQLITRVAEVFALSAAERDLLRRVARADLSPAALPLPERASAADPQAAPEHPPELPTGTVTFLFTDIAGSTQRWEQHPRLMRANLAQHDAVLRAAIRQHSGAVVKGTGDGLIAAFAQAADGLEAALAGQRAIVAADWGAAGPLRVRMALHSGEAQLIDGDYFGPTLNRTARLLATGHGGQVLLSLAAAELLRDRLPANVQLRDLGAHQLKDLARPEQVFQAVAADLPADFPPLRTRDARLRILPTAPNPLIGREAELTALAALLGDPALRLLTLLGPGGTGKTRLAIAAADELVERFADGVCFVDLTPVRDSALVLPTIGRVLGLQESQERPMAEVVIAFLRTQALLLILDNCEQVVAAAPDIAALLADAPRLQVIATSREALRVAAEQIYPVPPLAVPAAGDNGLSAPAAQLFLARVRAGRGDLALAEEAGAAVAAICRRLDGLPLALELAAARMRHLTPQALLGRLAQPLDLLTSGARDLPSRQQTLRATIAWSYDLLNEAEQTLFRRLGVFIGGWDIAAAEAVGGLGAATLDRLGSLIDKSLVGQGSGVGDEPRYTMLETIREFALEQLAVCREDVATSERHADYFLELMERSDLRSAEHDHQIQRLSNDLDNVRAALTYWEEGGEHAVLARACVALQLFWFVRGDAAEGLRWAERVVANGRGTLAGQPLLWARLLCAAGMLHNAQSSFERALLLLTEALSLAEAINDSTTCADARDGLGYTAFWQGEYAVAKQQWTEALALNRIRDDAYRTGWIASSLCYSFSLDGDLPGALALAEEATSIFRSLGVRRMLGNVLNDLAYFAIEAGDDQQAIPLLTESITIARETADRDTLAAALKNQGEVMLYSGHTEQALALLTESDMLYQQTGDRRRRVVTLCELADVHRILGDRSAANDLLRQQLILCGELGSPHSYSYGLRTTARLLAQYGMPDWAAKLFGADEALREQHAIPFWQREYALYHQDLAALRSSLSKDAFAAAWAAGRALSVEAATAEALAWLAAAQHGLHAAQAPEAGQDAAEEP